MNINTGLNPYNSNYVNGADMTKLSQSQSLTGSVTDNLKEGEVFEGSVNSIDNGKVIIGLANGQTMTARLDAGVSLTPGQSVFFEVKSNDGNLIQIRPVSLTSLDANPTLLKALDMANLAATERTINMVNSMMQNSMSVSPESLTAMNRAMINNPDVDIQTLVTMSKSNLPITPENVSMFQNYANDKAVLSDNFNVISDMLHEIMTSSEVSTGDVIGINNAIRDIFVNTNEAIAVEATAVEGAPAESTAVVTEGHTAVNAENTATVLDSAAVTTENATVLEPGQQPQVNGQTLNPEQISAGMVETEAIITNQTESTAVNQAQVMENELGTQVLNTFASEKQIDSFKTILNTMPDFPKDNHEIFAENGTLKADADMNQVFREITDYLNNHPDIPKQTLNDIIGAPLYKGLLKNIITNSFAMEPKEIT